MKKFIAVASVIALLALVVPAVKASQDDNSFLVDVHVTSEMAVDCNSLADVHMLPNIGGLIGGLATGATTCNVATSGVDGWDMYIRGDSYNSAHAGILPLDGLQTNDSDTYKHFGAFGSTTVPAAWTVTDASLFGYNVAGSFAEVGFSGNKFAALYGSDTAVNTGMGLLAAHSDFPSALGGDDVTFNFQAQFVPGATQDHMVEGTYSTDVMVTAITQ